MLNQEMNNIIKISQAITMLATNDAEKGQKKTKVMLITALKLNNELYADFYYAIYEHHYKQSCTLSSIKGRIIQYAYDEGTEVAKKSSDCNELEIDAVAKQLHFGVLFRDAYKDGFDNQKILNTDPQKLPRYKRAQQHSDSKTKDPALPTPAGKPKKKAG